VGAFEECKRVDDELQSFLQFAASRERGFLTGRLADCGSGMKVSFRVHLPALSFTGKLQETVEELGRRGVGVRDCFGMSPEKTSALGSFYEVCTRTAGNGSEIDQMANAVGALRTLVETERRLSAEAFASRPTEIRDKVYRAYAGAKFSLLCSARSAVEAVGAIKWGRNLGLLGGISGGELSALVYRVQTGHIQFVMRNREFGFPEDVARSRTLCENHIRALLMQEAFGRLTF
jgi:protein arginine kinase